MRLKLVGLLLPILLLPAWSSRAEVGGGLFPYPEAREGNGELRHLGGLPVLLVQGTPDEIGKQIGLLAARPAPRVAQYPRDLLRWFGAEWAWTGFLSIGKGMLPRFPPDHLAELEAIAQHSGVERDLVVAGNTFFDIKKTIACSSVLVEASRSKTGAILFGRNLDFPTLGYLQHYSLVTVYRPAGKRAFVSIGFPGLVGVLSGMNDAGLCLAVHEVYMGADQTPQFDGKGMPFAVLLRRVLEECATIEEAADLLRKLPRTTHMNLPMADEKSVAVLEVTTKTVIVRRPREGVCHCTNHFLAPELKVAGHRNTYETLDRYSILSERTQARQFGVEELQAALHAANLAQHTLQTMVFEPQSRTLHLATGRCPSSAEPMRKLELKELLQGKKP